MDSPLVGFLAFVALTAGHFLRAGDVRQASQLAHFFPIRKKST